MWWFSLRFWGLGSHVDRWTRPAQIRSPGRLDQLPTPLSVKYPCGGGRRDEGGTRCVDASRSGLTPVTDWVADETE
jgi:hypothetical protein